jgi:teichuronic acid biosynthesis protein TuaE
MALLFMFFILFKNSDRIKSIILIIGFLFIIIITFSNLIINLLNNFITGIGSLRLDEDSVVARINLIRNSLYFLMESYGFGVGAGNTEFYLANNQVFNTYGNTNVHNWWINILTDYGVFIFTGYVIVYIGLIITLLKINYRASNNKIKMISESLICSLVAFFLSSMSPSSMISLNYQWVLFAFAIGFTNFNNKKNKLKGSLEP